jgi:hypothetical protein
MVKKSIAAALLVCMVAWAEMALAPMFFMHAWHLQPSNEVAEHHALHHGVMPAGHPCCPKVNQTENALPLQFAASGLPCQDEHRCCFLQGSHNPPAPVSARQGLSRAIAASEIAEFSPAHSESRISAIAVVAPGPLPGALDMVLRV